MVAPKNPQNYLNEDLNKKLRKAIIEVNKGTPCSVAARNNAINESTLRYKIKQKQGNFVKRGPKEVLRADCKQKLVDYLKDRSDMGKLIYLMVDFFSGYFIMMVIK